MAISTSSLPTYRAPSKSPPTIKLNDSRRILQAADGTKVYLSITRYKFFKILFENFNYVTSEPTINEYVYGIHKAKYGTVRVHVSGLRKSIAPLGLKISTVRSGGYVLEAASG